jgi:hypothetical protein
MRPQPYDSEAKGGVNRIYKSPVKTLGVNEKINTESFTNIYNQVALNKVNQSSVTRGIPGNQPKKSPGTSMGLMNKQP